MATAESGARGGDERELARSLRQRNGGAVGQSDLVLQTKQAAGRGGALCDVWRPGGVAVAHGGTRKELGVENGV